MSESVGPSGEAVNVLSCTLLETLSVRDFRNLRPTTPLAAGPRAAAGGATAMLDVSDGLLRDGSRLAAASGVRVALRQRDHKAVEGS